MFVVIVITTLILLDYDSLCVDPNFGPHGEPQLWFPFREETLSPSELWMWIYTWNLQFDFPKIGE